MCQTSDPIALLSRHRPSHTTTHPRSNLLLLRSVSIIAATVCPATTSLSTHFRASSGSPHGLGSLARFLPLPSKFVGPVSIIRREQLAGLCPTHGEVSITGPVRTVLHRMPPATKEAGGTERSSVSPSPSTSPFRKPPATRKSSRAETSRRWRGQ